MAFIELSFKFTVPLIAHRTIELLLHSTFIFEAPLSNDYFKQANIEYRAAKFTINGGLLEFVVTTLILVCFCLISSSEVVQGQGTPQFSALIVLGDSTLDAGNKNNINTSAKCNFSPYGRDFPSGIPTGRFSNGKLTSDFLGITSKYSTFIFLYTFQGLNNFSQSHFCIF